MELKVIKERLDALVAGMLAKGVREPDAAFRIESNVTDFNVTLSWPDKKRYRDFVYFRGTVAEALDGAAAYVAALPTPEQARMKEFMLSLGETIELGKKVDTEVDFINPLVVLMEKLSKNALTGPVA